MQAATERQNDLRLGQKNLFDAFAGNGTAAASAPEPLPDVPPWAEAEKLRLLRTTSPFDRSIDVTRNVNNCPVRVCNVRRLSFCPFLFLTSPLFCSFPVNLLFSSYLLLFSF